jgi:hypothetical protein
MSPHHHCEYSIAGKAAQLTPFQKAASEESAMDMLLGGLAFAAIIFGQFAAVIAVHGERKSREFEAFSPPHVDHRTRLIWECGS